MGEWRTVSDVAVAKGLVGGPFGSSLGGKDYVAAGVPVIRGTNIGDGGRYCGGEFVFVTEEKADSELSGNIAIPGDVIFTQRGTLGQVGIVPGEPYERYVISQSQMRLRPDPATASPDFVYYYFRLPSTVSTIQKNAITTGVPHINLAILGRLPIRLPGLGVQRGIVDVLRALDDKIDVNGRIAGMHEDILGLHFERLACDVEGARGSVPASELVEFNPGVPAPSRSDAVYLEMAALPTRTARVASFTRREPKPGTRFQNRDTVMARITPCLENGKTAFVDFMPEGETGVGSTEFIVMRPRAGIPTHFPYFLARSTRFRGIAIRNMVGSSGRQRVSAHQLRDVPLVRPPADELARFDDVASRAFAHLKSLGEESSTLAELRDTILPRLMSGELRVRDAERLVGNAT